MSSPGRPIDRPEPEPPPTRKLVHQGRLRPQASVETRVGDEPAPSQRRFDETARYGDPADDSARTLVEADQQAPELPVDATRFPIAERGTYIIEGKFAQGGIGRILRAHDPRLDRPVALKELLVHGRKVDEERFIREVLLTARLQHPGIVPVYAAGRWSSGEPFYAMKLVSGRSFDKLLAETRDLPQRLALLPHVLTIAETVAYAHSQGIIHRDLKPQNVLVGAFGETVVIDWGLAKEIDGPDPWQSGARPITASTPPARDLTHAGAVVGTPGYMSPEQADGEHVDARTDVYALGAILYHLLTGALPYEATNPLAVVYKTVYEEPVPLRSREPRAPEELVAIVAKAMARDPERRYASAKAFADDLRRFQTGQIVGAYRYTPYERVRRFVRRYRALLGLAAVSVLLIVGVTAVSFAEVREERDAARTARDQAEVARAQAVDAEARAESARAEALRRADNLALEQARLLIDDDPPEALRLLHSVSAGSDWRRVRQLAAELDQRGVPRVLRGHQAAVSRAIFSPDGALLATTSDDCTLRVWDMSTRTSRAYHGHTSEVWRAAWSPDQRRVASTSKDRSVRVWDLQTGEAQVLLGHTSGVRNVIFTPDGAKLYTADDHQNLRRWDLATGASEVIDRCIANTFPWTEQRIACLDDEGNAVHVYDLATGERTVVAAGSSARLARAGAASADGRWIAAGSASGEIWLYDQVARGGRRLALQTPRADLAGLAVREMRFSPDSRRLLAPADRAYLGHFDLESGTSVLLQPHDGYTRRASFSPDSRLVVSVGGDSTVSVWDDANDTVYPLVATRALMIDAQFSPDGRRLAAVGNDPRVFLWSPASFAREQWLLPSERPVHGRSRTLAPRVQLAALADDATVHVLDTRTLSARIALQSERPPTAIILSSDGTALLAAHEGGSVTAWSVGGGHVSLRRALGPGCLEARLSAADDDPRIFVACEDGRVLEFDAAAADPLTLLVRAATRPAILSLPGRKDILIGDLAGDLSLVPGPGQPPRPLAHYPQSVTALAAVPGADEVVVSSENTVERLSLAGEVLGAYPGHRLQVNKLAVSADGRRLLTASRDNVLRVFTRETGALELEILAPDTIEQTSDFSPDGSQIAVSVHNGDVLVWDITADERGVARAREYRRLRGQAVSGLPSFSDDGRALLVLGDDRVIRWRDEVPADAAGLRRWLDDLVDAGPPPTTAVGCARPE